MASAILNINSVNLLKYSALVFGVWYGVSRTASLTSYVKVREGETKKKHYEDLVEEGKIAYDAFTMAKLSDEAKKSHIDSIDPNSYKFNAEVALNWLLAKTDVPPPAKQKK